MKHKLIHLAVFALLLLIAATSLGASKQTTFEKAILDGLHEPSKIEQFTGNRPTEHKGDLDLSDVVLDFPLYIYGGHVNLTNVKAKNIVLSQCTGTVDGIRVGGENVDLALSLIRCNDVTVRNSRFGKSRIGLLVTSGDPWTFEDTAKRAGISYWKQSNVWKEGTNLAGQGPVGVDPIFVGNGKNRITVPTPPYPQPGWFQGSTPRARDGLVQIEGIPDGSARWVSENTIELKSGVFEIGRNYRYNTYHPEFLSRNITIEDNSFHNYWLAGVNTFFTEYLIVRSNRFYVALPDDATIIVEESLRTHVLDNIRVPMDPRTEPVPTWNTRAIGFIGLMVNPVVRGNEGLTVSAQHRNRPAFGYTGDKELFWVGGKSPWLEMKAN